MANKKTKPVYRITLLCRGGNASEVNRNDGGSITIAENVNDPSFKCPLCNKTLVYIPKERRLSSHGEVLPGSDRKAPLPKHELRSVTETQST